MDLRKLQNLCYFFLILVAANAATSQSDSATLTQSDIDINPACGNGRTTCLKTIQRAKYNCQNPTNNGNANTYDRVCFCNELKLSSSCSTACTPDPEKEKPADFFNNICRSVPDWRLPASPTALDAFLPWSQTVRFNHTEANDPTAKAPTCPSPANNLGAFAAANIAAIIATIFRIRQTKMRKRCGIRNTSYGIQFVFMMGRVFSEFIGHAINAYQVKQSPGFSSVSMRHLILLWVVRPRIAWVGLFLLLQKPKPRKFHSSVVSNLGSEIVIEIVSAIYMGVTVHFASKNGYYLVDSLRPDDALTISTAAKKLYAGALMGLILLFINLPIAAIALVFIMGQYERVGRGKEYNTAMGLPVAMFGSVTAFIYVAQWLFWAGFILLSGDLYCPPELGKLATVWAVFSVIGVFMGFGF